ncbi:MAG: universal stress protein [Proteobacteria bacterium]|nr:universal stress protein [Pseudomonadota bacterium]
MKRFKNILLLLDPEVKVSAALDKAVSLATRNGARITLFSVLKPPSGLLGYSESVAQSQLTSAITERREWLRGLTLSLAHDNIELEIEVVEGIPFLEIIRRVLREQHDLVITTAEQKKGIRERLFGTTSMHLIRKCPCPVWVVKRAQTKPFSRILAAVDPSVYDPQRDSLNPLILQLASSMARTEAAELHVVHVWHLFGEDYVRNRDMIKTVESAKLIEKDQHKKYFDTLLGNSNITDLKPHLHLLEGEPDERIPDLAMEQGIDLLVMGSVCRSGVAGFLIGNTAEEVLNQVDCSVLTLKPDGFVTPVTLE